MTTIKSNKTRNITLIIVLLLALLGSWFVVIQVSVLRKIEAYVLQDVYSEEVKNRFAPNGVIYTQVCRFDLLKPEVYSVFNEEDKNQYVTYQTIQRQNLFSNTWSYAYEKNDLGGTRFRDKTFEEVKTIIKDKGCQGVRDIKNDPNITNYKPLTQEEIDANRNRRELDTNINDVITSERALVNDIILNSSVDRTKRISTCLELLVALDNKNPTVQGYKINFGRDAQEAAPDLFQFPSYEAYCANLVDTQST